MNLFDLKCSHIPYGEDILCLESWKRWANCKDGEYGDKGGAEIIRTCLKYGD